MSSNNVVASQTFIEGIPKCELHLHIEGTFEPELMFKIGERNKVALSYGSVEEVRAAYDFADLQSFLDIYYAACNVLLQECDFYDLTWAYIERIHKDNVRHAEIFFDPQTHTDRGVSFSNVINGISRALKDAETKFGITSKLIMCFLRHLSADAAMKTLEEALPFKHLICAVGLDSGEAGNPPAKFTQVYKKALEHGFLTVAHAGEEGPASNITSSLDDLQVSRIDHGVRCLEDDAVVQRLVEQRIPLTCCPLSNRKLQVFERYFDGKNITRDLLDKGIVVTINSDDPAYFGGYMVDNFMATAEECSLSEEEVRQICINAFESSFLTVEEKAKYVEQVKSFSL